MEKLFRAVSFAVSAHAGQSRKGSRGGRVDPFVTHPLGVARLLSEAGVTDETTLVAAVLHDTVEDTETTLAVVAEEFGPEVASVVEELTSPPGLTSKERKAWQVEHAPRMSCAAKLVKVADQAHNLRDARTLAPWPSERTLEYAAWAEQVVNAIFPEVVSEESTPENWLKSCFGSEAGQLRSMFKAF